MIEDDRGTFRNRTYARQLVEFAGLRYDNKTPTDIDMFIDFGGRGFVVGEFKHCNTPLKYGQRLALERIADACDRGGVPTLTLVASHEQDIGDVPAKDAVVTEYRWQGEWHRPQQTWTVSGIVSRFYSYCNAA